MAPDLSMSFDPSQVEVNKSAASDAASAAASVSSAAASAISAVAARSSAWDAGVSLRTYDGGKASISYGQVRLGNFFDGGNARGSFDGGSAGSF